MLQLNDVLEVLNFLLNPMLSDFGEEVGLELRKNDGVPTECTHHFSVDFIWKSTSFDR